MDPQITPDTFCSYTPSPAEADTTVFFISGNPGLISYYHPFLSLLGQYLADDQDPLSKGASVEKTPSHFQIYGCSLGGFEVPCDKTSPSGTNGGNGPPDAAQSGRSKLYSLEDQICFVHDKLNTLMTENAASAKTPSASSRRQKVILMGHSVGAYIAMEVLRRHREASPSPEPHRQYTTDFDIIGGVMLFPTVKDIAHSPAGQKLTVRLIPPFYTANRPILILAISAMQTLLSFFPHFALVVGFLAHLLTTLLPSAALKWLIKLVMNDPPTHARDTTFSFLNSPGGVRQALYVTPLPSAFLSLVICPRLMRKTRHMAADEMRTITSDKWTDDVWGVARAREPLTKLFFYFGRNDHWVAERTRDELIALRGGTDGESGPKMFVCEEGLPHAFCLSESENWESIWAIGADSHVGHNDVMARKVAGMIQDIGGN
ncbi:uncharacterized protein N7482_003012 [Penicillium canariense]|uniref:Lipid droplet-associated hydrolase n=1 Tax=Penicillium canariense TaxID=189055 RepID=A0A9W9IH83_9EURO|nr:uncharacterized protein N7482_003012 [Penicillium canariense]KAJ5177135.1 hypothetical protein N7482_003012 [Penicillium canariense]